MAQLFPVMRDLISKGKTVQITVTGDSMIPFLRHGIDSVSLADPLMCSPKKGDIILMQRPDGHYVLHRIIRLKGEAFFMRGDAQIPSEGPFGTDRILAVVKKVRRKDREIRTESLSWRFLSYLWQQLLPFRSPLIRCIARLSAYKKARKLKVQKT